MSSSSKGAGIGLGLFVLLGVLPFSAAVGYAMLYSLGIIGSLSEGWTLRHYSRILQSGELLVSLAYSAAIAAVSMLVSVGGALLMVVTSYRSLDRRWIGYVLYLPLCMPGVVVAFFMTQLLSKAGYLSRWSYALGWTEGVHDFPALVQDRWAVGIVLTFISVVLPFFVLLFKSVYKQEHIDELTELASTLGASSRQSQYKVSIPILLQKTKVLIGLYFILLLGAYEAPLLLGRESPQMLSVLIVRELQQYDLQQIAEGYAIAVIYTAIISLLVLSIFWRQASRQTYA